MSQNILTSYDAGLHTCTATDSLGNTGSATTEMSLFGKSTIQLLSLIVFIIFLRLHALLMQVWVST